MRSGFLAAAAIALVAAAAGVSGSWIAGLLLGVAVGNWLVMWLQSRRS